MKRRSRAGGEPVNSRRRGAAPKRHSAPKLPRRRSSSAAGQETEVARLTRERDEALEHQTATSDILKVISRSTFNLQAVLDTLVESAARLCDADFGFIFQRFGDHLHLAATHGFSGDFIEYQKQNPVPLKRESLTGRTALERKTVHIPDVLEDPEYTWTKSIELAQFRTMLGIPLLREGLAIGVIALLRRTVRPFTDHQIELVTTFADQAVIAIENVRLFEAEQQRTRELRESLQQQIATSDVLQVISSSPGDLEPVFKTMLENAARICEATFGNVYLWDGDAFRLVAAHNTPPAFAESRRRAPFRPKSGHPFRDLVETKKVFHVTDVAALPAYEEHDPQIVEPVELGGIRTCLGVPMLRDNDLIGALVMFRQEVRPFGDKQIGLLTNFAAQAVIAIENARLLNELRQRTTDLAEALEQQTATSEVLQVISGSPGDLQPIFAALLENAARICDANFGNIFRWDGDALWLVATHNTPPAFTEHRRRMPFRPNQGNPIGDMLKANATIHVADLARDDRYVQRRDPEVVAAVELGGIRTFAAVPMLKNEKLIGAIILYRREVRPFSDKQIELVKNFAAQAVIAIENARLLNELRQRTTDLTEALDQQTATSEVLRVISSSPGELQPVFDEMLENAVRICDATYGNIYNRDGDIFRLVASYKTPPAFTEYRRRNPMTGSGAHWGDPMLRSKTQVHIADLTLERGFIERDPSFVAAVELGGARSALAVPMLKEGEIIGAFALARQDVRPFTEKQIALVTNFADQAVIAIENARLLNELRRRTADLTESLEQQTATSEILKVISTSPGKLEPVFAAILENATRICGATLGSLNLCEDDSFRVIAMHGVEPTLRDKLQGSLLRLAPNSALGRLSRRKEITHIADVLAEPGFFETPARFDGPYLALEAGARTLLAVPMLKDTQLIGGILIYRQVVQPFTEKQMTLVASFAAQAVIAIENARLLSELRQRTGELGRSVEELRALGEVSQAINSTLELELVLSTIVAKAVQLSETDAGAIYVFDTSQRRFQLRATYGMDGEVIEALQRSHIGLDEPHIAAAFSQNDPMQFNDLQENAPTPVNDIILRAGYRARLLAPLVHGKDVIGMLVVRRRIPGAFSQSTVNLMKTFASQSVLAIQNARLFKDVEARTRELAKSLEDLRTAQDRLIQTQKLASLGQLTAGIAHEIKNPLNFVNNFSGVSVELIDELQEALGKVKIDQQTRAEITELADTLRENLDKIVQHGKRADSIVKNMLLHSREGSGEHRPVDINALVEQAVNLAYHGARAEKQGFNIALARSFDPAAGEVDVFPQEITRVLLNLISNGFYAAAKRKAQASSYGYVPKLAAATKDLGDRVQISIRDNGTGIPPEVRDKIFNPFFTTKPAGEGTGLGLSLSHDIVVKQHSGSIEIDTQPGEFTEFKITIPRSAASLGKSGERS